MKNEDIEESRKKSRAVGGAILVIIGTGLLLQRLDLDLPNWLFSWQMILIAIGIVLGFRHNFRMGGWLVMVAIGGIFLAGEIQAWPYDTARFIWPVVMIGVGVIVIFKRNYSTKEWADRKKQFGASIASASGDDVIDATAIFGSVDKVIMSKNFKGGDVTSIFGGTVLNFMKADIDGTAKLDVTAIMGGCEIIIPANWKVKMDVTTIMGGVDDKRYLDTIPSTGPEKLLILTGTCIMGGLEIKSYA
ncbi:LiaF transmembrane domain-containing protein [Chitinophaga sp. RAB17]|uniref:LiaF transmembrane domain-containing protein n=1 Tax=Chitinophaga sp. RAB17 TaxID=3233049 RepID=UPI003F90B682